jgi:hypothetical protein
LKICLKDNIISDLTNKIQIKDKTLTKKIIWIRITPQETSKRKILNISIIIKLKTFYNLFGRYLKISFLKNKNKG